MYSRSDSIIESDSGWWGPSLCCWHLKQGQTECTASQLQPVTWELIYNPFQWISPQSEFAESTPALVPHVTFTLMKHSHEHMYFLQSTHIFILKTQFNPCDTVMLITWKPKATEHVSSPTIHGRIGLKSICCIHTALTLHAFPMYIIWVIDIHCGHNDYGLEIRESACFIWLILDEKRSISTTNIFIQ